MKNKLLAVVIKPLINRLGTALAAFLVASAGADASLANEVATGLIALALIMLDLFNAAVDREKIKAAVEADRSGL